MTKTLLAVLFVSCVCLCAFTGSASAQVGSDCIVEFSCGVYTIYYIPGGSGCIPTPPPGVFNCSAFDWTTYCEVWSYKCVSPDGVGEAGGGPGGSGGCGGVGGSGGPGGSGEPGGSGGPGGGGPGGSGGPDGGCSAGKPINLATGNTWITQTDFRIAGLGGGLNLTRTWNSIWPSTQMAYQVGMFGPNWRSTYEERVFLGSDLYMKYARSDGSFWTFGYQGPGFLVAAPANQNVSLVQGTSYWTMTFQDGEQRLFDNTSGDLIAIIDRNGNTTQLSYDAVGRLAIVTDPASRHLYFSYGGPSNLLVTSITSDFGVSVSYSYDSQGRLGQVTEPDGSTISFQYDSNSMISAVLDANGRVLESHTYDSLGRGLTSSQANGVDSVSVNYQ